MSSPEAHKWIEGNGIGSAEYFGQYLEITRRNYNHKMISWATLGGVEPERYNRVEHGKEPKPPALDELNEWTRGWGLTRDEIIDLKMSGGYDISAYLGPLDPETVAKGLIELLRPTT